VQRHTSTRAVQILVAFFAPLDAAVRGSSSTTGRLELIGWKSVRTIQLRDLNGRYDLAAVTARS